MRAMTVLLVMPSDHNLLYNRTLDHRRVQHRHIRSSSLEIILARETYVSCLPLLAASDCRDGVQRSSVEGNRAGPETSVPAAQKSAVCESDFNDASMR